MNVYLYIYLIFLNHPEKMRYIYLLTFQAIGISLLICPGCEDFIIGCLKSKAPIWNIEPEWVDALSHDSQPRRKCKIATLYFRKCKLGLAHFKPVAKKKNLKKKKSTQPPFPGLQSKNK